MTLWSARQRVAFAAAVAQSWLPAYDAFAVEESWGDPPTLHRGLDAVWSHVQGSALARADLARHRQLIDDITPHVDDFDAHRLLRRGRRAPLVRRYETESRATHLHASEFPHF